MQIDDRRIRIDGTGNDAAIVQLCIIEIDLNTFALLCERAVRLPNHRLWNDCNNLGAEFQIEVKSVAIGSGAGRFERFIRHRTNGSATTGPKDFYVVEIIWKRLREPRDDDPTVGRIGKVEILRRHDDIGRDSSGTEDTITSGTRDTDPASKGRLTNVIATGETEKQFPGGLTEGVGPSRRESLAGIRSDRQETEV